MLTLSPTMAAPVCRVGDPLELTCTASVEFIRWSILQANEHGTLTEIATPVKIKCKSNEANRSSFSYLHFCENFCSISFTSGLY